MVPGVLRVLRRLYRPGAGASQRRLWEVIRTLARYLAERPQVPTGDDLEILLAVSAAISEEKRAAYLSASRLVNRKKTPEKL